MAAAVSGRTNRSKGFCARTIVVFLREQVSRRDSLSNDLDVSIVIIFSLFVAAILGFSAHRASICTVKAVAEVLSTRRAYMFLSFLKTILCVEIVSLFLMWWWPSAGGSDHAWALTWFSMAGGFLFGMGAVLNKGCAFSTLTRLSDGQLSMLLTLAGFCVGAFAYVWISEPLGHRPDAAPLLQNNASKFWQLPFIAAVSIWVIWEILRLVRTRTAGPGWGAVLLAPSYRLSTAAILMGLSNGVLYALYGSWTYTGTLSREAGQIHGEGGGVSAIYWALFLAVLAGMGVSSWQRRSFRLRWHPSPSWAVNLVAGFMMGVGAALTPGGNDVLVFHSIPQLSPHAVPAFLAMTAGIALPLLIMRLVTGAHMMQVDCRGDVCHVRSQVPARCPPSRPYVQQDGINPFKGDRVAPGERGRVRAPAITKRDLAARYGATARKRDGVELR